MREDAAAALARALADTSLHERIRVTCEDWALADRVRADFGEGSIDILVHSLANGPEVKKKDGDKPAPQVKEVQVSGEWVFKRVQ